jgi:hypothetical protein
MGNLGDAKDTPKLAPKMDQNYSRFAAFFSAFSPVF